LNGSQHSVRMLYCKMLKKYDHDFTWNLKQYRRQMDVKQASV
jgi:hypothetical protein